MSIFKKTKPEPAAEVSSAVSALEQAKQVVAGLEAKTEAAARHTNTLAEERAAIALQAHTGSESARLRLDSLHAEISVQTSEAISIDAALSEARENVKKAEAVVAEQNEKRRQAEGQRIAGLILAESARFDQAAAEMAAALRRRHELHREMAAVGTINPDSLNQMLRPTCINRALVKAGLAGFAGLDRVGVHLLATLADHDGRIVGRPARPAKVAADAAER